MKNVTYETPASRFTELCSVTYHKELESEPTQSSDANSDLQIKNPHFYPLQSRPAILDVFQERVEKDLQKFETEINQAHQQYVNGNLTQKERRAIEELKQNSYLLIRLADKGSVVILMNAKL